jgi:hypothetical protein
MYFAIHNFGCNFTAGHRYWIQVHFLLLKMYFLPN